MVREQWLGGFTKRTVTTAVNAPGCLCHGCGWRWRWIFSRIQRRRYDCLPENDGSQGFTKRLPTTADGAMAVMHWMWMAMGMWTFSQHRQMMTLLRGMRTMERVFTKRAISTAVDGAYTVYALDVDSDGDVDVLSRRRRRVPLPGMKTMDLRASPPEVLIRAQRLRCRGTSTAMVILI